MDESRRALRNALFANVVRQEFAFFDDPANSPFAISSRLADDTDLVAKAYGQPLSSLADVTFALGIAYTVALVAVSLLPTLLGVTGGLYLGVALLLGLAFVKQVAEFARCANATTAGRMFRYSILYLPLVLVVAALDKAL